MVLWFLWFSGSRGSLVLVVLWFLWFSGSRGSRGLLVFVVLLDLVVLLVPVALVVLGPDPITPRSLAIDGTTYRHVGTLE